MTAKEGTNNAKDVIYIDVDDEITAVIDKVRSSGKKIVALVLPKRATVLQSIVNMKLLKRAADDAKKHLVLVTAENGLMPLAGTVGIHVAKSINSKPEIPDGPDRGDDKPEMVEEAADDGDEPVDESKTVGELSGMAPAADDDETIQLDDEEEESEADEAAADKPKKGKNKKFKIPNFNRFRVAMVLAVVAVLLLSGLSYAAFVVAPKATVTIKTDRQTVSTSVPVTLKTAADAVLDVNNAIVPATSQQVKKTLTGDAPATGSVNNGDKATGDVTLILTDCSKDQVTVPAGSGLSASGKTFITQQSATLYSVKIGGVCKNSTHLADSSATVGVKAQTGGAAYNIGASNFTVAGFSNVTGQSSAAMSGGTDDIVKVLTQADVDAATQKITQQDTKPIQTELRNALIGRQLFPIDSTFSVGTPDTTMSAQVGAPAESVTVTQAITYSMLGAKKDDLQAIVDKAASAKIDTKKQKILTYGLDNATFSVQSNTADSSLLTIQTTVSTGAELNIAAIKKQIAGKKAGDAQELIKANPGITDVTVKYSPFWVSSIPKNTKKITVVIQEQQATSSNADSNP